MDKGGRSHGAESAGFPVRTLAGRWTLGIFVELAEGGRRYQDPHGALDGISSKMLAETIRRAERDGLIARHLESERIETATLYELTDLGARRAAGGNGRVDRRQLAGSRSGSPPLGSATARKRVSRRSTPHDPVGAHT